MIIMPTLYHWAKHISFIEFLFCFVDAWYENNWKINSYLLCSYMDQAMANLSNCFQFTLVSVDKSVHSWSEFTLEIVVNARNLIVTCRKYRFYYINSFYGFYLHIFRNINSWKPWNEIMIAI